MTSLTIGLLPLEKYYCRVSTQKLKDIHHVRYTFRVGISLRNKSGFELHVEYVEPISESITFTNGQTFKNERSVGKKSLPNNNMPPNLLLRAEWDDTHETNDNDAKPAFVKYRVIVKMMESPVPLEYNLNISSAEYRV